LYGSEGVRNCVKDKDGNLKGGFKYSGNAEFIFNTFFNLANPYLPIKDCTL